jgi:hypothetical protein
VESSLVRSSGTAASASPGACSHPHINGIPCRVFL